IRWSLSGVGRVDRVRTVHDQVNLTRVVFPATQARPTALVPGSTPRTTRSNMCSPKTTAPLGTGQSHPCNLAHPGDRNATASTARGSARLGQDLLGDVEVRVDGLDVFEVFEVLDQPEHRAGLVAADGDAGLWKHRELGGHYDYSFVLQRLAHRYQGIGLRHYLPLLPGVPKVFCSRLEDELQEPVLVGRRCLPHRDEALAVKHPGNASGVTEAPPQAGEGVPDLLARAITVVGHGLDEDGHAAGPIALIDDLLVVSATRFAGPALDGPIDVVYRHRVIPGFLDRRGERHVALDARPPVPSGHLYRPSELAEHPAALVVGGGLFPLDLGPLRMAGHCGPLPSQPDRRRRCSWSRGSPAISG